MTFTMFQADAFTEKLFGGNPAAVVPLEKWLPDETMQKIASENNLAETAFFVPDGNGFHLRWFTPVVEVNLCGHATLATAHILYQHLGYDKPAIDFQSRSGRLWVKKNGEFLTLDFPADELVRMEIPECISKAITIVPAEMYKGKNMLLVVLNSQAELEELAPVMTFIKQAHPHGVVFTAKGNEVDFVSRCFFPNSGIDEDPVTGSAHCLLAPYWSLRFGKNQLTAMQLSRRQGHLWCSIAGDRVEISGKAVTYMTAQIMIPDDVTLPKTTLPV